MFAIRITISYHLFRLSLLQAFEFDMEFGQLIKTRRGCWREENPLGQDAHLIDRHTERRRIWRWTRTKLKDSVTKGRRRITAPKNTHLRWTRCRLLNFSNRMPMQTPLWTDPCMLSTSWNIVSTYETIFLKLKQIMQYQTAIRNAPPCRRRRTQLINIWPGRSVTPTLTQSCHLMGTTLLFKCFCAAELRLFGFLFFLRRYSATFRVLYFFWAHKGVTFRFCDFFLCVSFVARIEKFEIWKSSQNRGDYSLGTYYNY